MKVGDIHDRYLSRMDAVNRILPSAGALSSAVTLRSPSVFENQVARSTVTTRSMIGIGQGWTVIRILHAAAVPHPHFLRVGFDLASVFARPPGLRIPPADLTHVILIYINYTES